MAVPEKFEDNTKVLDYISVLSRQTKVDVSNWNIVEIFAGETPDSLVLSSDEINRRFFAKLQEEWKGRPQVEAPPFEMDEEEAKQASFVLFNKARIIEDQLTYNRSRLVDFERSIENYKRSIAQTQESIKAQEAELEEAKKKPTPDIRDQLKEIAARGFYSGFKFRNGYLWCLTREVSMVDPTTKEKINLGRYALRVTLASEGGYHTICVYPHENPRRGFYSGRTEYHPFGATTGGVFCAADLGQAYYKDNSLKQIFISYEALFETPVGKLHWSPAEGEKVQGPLHAYYPK